MKRVLIFVAAVVLFAACQRNRASGADGATTKTETIAPANAQPAQTGTDALTQTTEIEDSRSEEEGGVTSPATATTTAATPSAKPAKAPAKKKRK